MPDIAVIRQQISQLDGFSSWLNKKEINELPKLLWDNENVIGVAPGNYNGGNGLIVATTRRVLFIDKGALGLSLKVEDFGYDKISSIQFSTGLLAGDVTIFASGNRAELKMIPKEFTKRIAEVIRNQMTVVQTPAAPPAPPVQAAAAPAGDDLISKLERLGQLKAQGVLSDEEFLAAKMKLLA